MFPLLLVLGAWAAMTAPRTDAHLLQRVPGRVGTDRRGANGLSSLFLPSIPIGSSLRASAPNPGDSPLHMCHFSPATKARAPHSAPLPLLNPHDQSAPSLPMSYGNAVLVPGEASGPTTQCTNPLPHLCTDPTCLLLASVPSTENTPAAVLWVTHSFCSQG